jgi:hypothetical protein
MPHVYGGKATKKQEKRVNKQLRRNREILNLQLIRPLSYNKFLPCSILLFFLLDSISRRREYHDSKLHEGMTCECSIRVLLRSDE